MKIGKVKKPFPVPFTFAALRKMSSSSHEIGKESNAARIVKNAASGTMMTEIIAEARPATVASAEKTEDRKSRKKSKSMTEGLLPRAVLYFPTYCGNT